MSCEERLRTLGLPSSETRKLKVDFMALYSFLRRKSGEGPADLFCWYLVTEYMERVQSCFKRNSDFTWKYFFTERMVRLRNKLSGELVNASSLTVFRMHLGNALMPIGQAVGLDDCCRSLPTELVNIKIYYGHIPLPPPVIYYVWIELHSPISYWEWRQVHQHIHM